jgi:hypothetical protein
MKVSNGSGIICSPSFLCTAASSTEIAFSKLDYKGQPYDYANWYINIGTQATNCSAVHIQEILISESDTVTSPSSMTTIVAFSGSATTDATHGWTIPAVATTGKGGCIEFQMDLRARKKYIGAIILGAAAASNVTKIGAVVLLSKAKTSHDTLAAKNHAGTVYGNLADTNAVGCMALVTG